MRKRDHKLEYAHKIVKKHLGIFYKIGNREISVSNDFDLIKSHPQLQKYLNYLLSRGYNIQYSIMPRKKDVTEDKSSKIYIGSLIGNLKIVLPSSSGGSVVEASRFHTRILDEIKETVRDGVSGAMLKLLKDGDRNIFLQVDSLCKEISIEIDATPSCL